MRKQRRAKYLDLWESASAAGAAQPRPGCLADGIVLANLVDSSPGSSIGPARPGAPASAESPTADGEVETTEASSERRRRERMTMASLVITIAVTTAMVAVLDFLTSAELVGSILFTLPIALCALQRSRRLLWSIAGLAAFLTIAAELWGVGRAEMHDPWVGSMNRGLLVASLCTLTAFVDLWLQRTEGFAAGALKIQRQRHSSLLQNERLEDLVAAATRDIEMLEVAKRHLAQMEGRYRGLLEAAPDAMVVVNQVGEIVLLNLQAEKQFGYRRDALVGQQVTAIIPEGFAERLIADGTRTAADALAQHIGMGVELSGRRMDGSTFPIEIMLSPLDSADGILVTAAIRDISVRKAAELHLAQMEGRYRGLLEAAPDAMVVVNQAGEIVLLNLQAEKQFGYQRNELVGQQVKTLIPEGFAERLIADGTRTAAEALAQHIGTGIELTGRRKDGSAFPIEIMLSPLDSADGILVTAAIRDISVRKAAELNLAQMEGRYRGLLEAAPDAMVVVNQAGEIVLLNLQAENQFGYRRDELVGQPVKNLIPVGFAERLIADGTRTAAEALAQHIGTGIELSGRRKDGSAFPIEIMLSPLDSAQGVLVTAAIRDISMRKAAEQHLAQMEGRYRGLLEAAPDAMALVSMTGVIVLVNLEAERQFGYRRDDIVGQALTSIIPDIATMLPEVQQRILDAAASKADAVGQDIGAAIELCGLRQDGSEFPIEIMLSILHGADGALVTVAIRDITTRKATEARLLQTVAELNRSNEELGQFAYIASHDLQEPLRMVASYTQLLSRRYKGKLDADADEFITFAVDGANRMQRLIQDLLMYSRVGTAAQILVETSSERALTQAIANLRGVIEDSGAQVTHDPLPVVVADEGQLVQLFQNLVGNAIKYQGTGTPRVHISSTRGAGSTWVFSVKDNGLGIEAKYFERIFGMFQRLHKREEFAGTGIGLAICKKIVERHGGHITVESQPGNGSTFRFGLAGSKTQS
jgi:PAS domain S-box-containing protein